MGAEFLPYVQGVPFLLALLVISWLWRQEIKRTGTVAEALLAERREHSRTQWELDQERDARRKFEDKVDTLTREAHQLRTRLGETP